MQVGSVIILFSSSDLPAFEVSCSDSVRDIHTFEHCFHTDQTLVGNELFIQLVSQKTAVLKIAASGDRTFFSDLEKFRKRGYNISLFHVKNSPFLDAGRINEGDSVRQKNHMRIGGCMFSFS